MLQGFTAASTASSTIRDYILEIELEPLCGIRRIASSLSEGLSSSTAWASPYPSPLQFQEVGGPVLCFDIEGVTLRSLAPYNGP